MSFQSDIERGFAPSSPAGRGWGASVGSYQGGMGDQQDEYAYELAQVSQNIKHMTFNFNQIMDLDRFIGTERDIQEFRDKLNSKITATRDLSRIITQTLRKLSVASTNTGTAVERKERKRIVDKLTKDFTMFNDKFTTVTQRAQDQMEQLPAHPPPRTAGYQASGYVEDNDPEMERASLIQAQRAAEWQQVEAEHEFNSTLIAERDEAIKKLQGEMVEVHEIFRDLATLVGEQGEMINDIESNIEAASQHTKGGLVEVKKAADYQKKARSKLCIVAIIITVLVAIAVIAVIIYVATRPKS